MKQCAGHNPRTEPRSDRAIPCLLLERAVPETCSLELIPCSLERVGLWPTPRQVVACSLEWYHVRSSGQPTGYARPLQISLHFLHDSSSILLHSFPLTLSCTTWASLSYNKSPFNTTQNTTFHAETKYRKQRLIMSIHRNT